LCYWRYWRRWRYWRCRCIVLHHYALLLINFLY
jgi:hypothetical protein